MSALKQALHYVLAQRLAAWTTVQYIRALRLTGRCTIHNRSTLDDLINQKRPFITCFWHNRVLMYPYVWPYATTLHPLISRHRDGALLSRVAAIYGFQTIAGSSSKGGSEAFRAMLRALKKGDCVSVTPDGPRGPRMRVSPGVVHVARVAGVPIIPIGFAASRCRVLKSWDRFIVPLPFADFTIEVGAPIEIDKNAGDDEVERVRSVLEQRLLTLTRELEQQVGQTPIDPAPEVVSPAMNEPVGQER